ncbi:malonate decarboxylase subunit alpha [Fluviispira multicolorata]|uniref:Malonate decarboxylase subunit alpha n=1 Tax=Fluviispira multicolorata TaxID=2654512 RepID=A0A833N5R1_9BACT|nr:malonate decarboxylase subunit alpha [Fluviispira multicolorata]KAB8033669.1 malonate decarboxylase subunit alpha [Fluviispira multicolorata]
MNYSQLKQNKALRINKANFLMNRKWIEEKNLIECLECLIEPYDKVCIEGNNQKQALLLSDALSKVNIEKINNLHVLQSTILFPLHMEVFEKGIANKVDFSYASIYGTRFAELAQKGDLKIQGMHTFLELYSRYFLDLTPRVCLVSAEKADFDGNLYTGANTEETPAIIEATAFKDGIVIVEVKEVIEKLPRIDIPSDWIDALVLNPKPQPIKPLFTRDPAKISNTKILMAMLAIKGIYAKYGANRVNHGVGYSTCAIELLLPTYAESLGLKGKICEYMMVNPLPTLIPAIEAGFVKRIVSPGGEVGMNEYVRSRPDVFFTGRDGALRSNRCFAQMAGLYAIDLFAGATLQIDIYGNSTTITSERMPGFGGAPNIGSNANARRHTTDAWLLAGKENQKQLNSIPNGKKIVLQIVETFQSSGAPSFVETLDALEIQKKMHLPLPPIMIYGEDVTHIITEEGIANLLLCRTIEEREQAIRSIAGATPVGLKRDKIKSDELRERRIVTYPEDIGIQRKDATQDLLAAKSMNDLIEISHGLYEPPAKFLRKTSN